MSFVIALYVREGIVMASDSRITLNTQIQQQGQPVTHIAVSASDANYKTFRAPNDVGISAYGAADIGGVPIAGFVESFMNEELGAGNVEINEVANRLLAYFRGQAGPPGTQFLVAGYKTENQRREQHIYQVDIVANTVQRRNPPGQQGAAWGGEADVLSRLVSRVAVQDQQGAFTQELPNHPIPWQFFTLQDAIDYAMYAVNVTIDSIRFQPRPKTVGGPVDVLVIKPNESFWVKRKELRAS